MKPTLPRITARATLAVSLAAALIGCQTTPTSTRVTVINETPGELLVSMIHAGSEDMVVSDASLMPSGAEAYEADHMGAAAVQVGVRPVEFASAPAQWIEFPQGGPYLLRVQGTATDLQFVPSLDGAGDLEAAGVQPIFTNRRFNEPPVLPSR